MANEEHLKRIKQGVDAWNKWRKEHADTSPDLSQTHLPRRNLRGANLSGADLSETYLRKANLFRANLSRAKLIGAKLIGTNLIGAKLTRANLSGAYLTEALLFEANLIGAKLNDAYVYKADLSSTDLGGANLGGAYLGGVNLSSADLSGANLSGADLTCASLVDTNLENANLNGCRIYGISAWNVQLNKKTRQSDLIITPRGEATVKVDDIQVAQFIYFILKYENLRNVLNAVTKRGVLILGRFGGGGLEVLRALGDALRQSGYLPIIFEFARPEDRDYTETVQTLAGLARFVVADLSGPSVPNELRATVPHFDIPVVPILEEGIHPYAMFVDLFKYEWVLRPIVQFESISALIQQLQDKIVTPAEKRIETRQAKLKEIFG